MDLLGELSDALIFGFKLDEQLLLAPFALLLVLDHSLHVRYLLND